MAMLIGERSFAAGEGSTRDPQRDAGSHSSLAPVPMRAEISPGVPRALPAHPPMCGRGGGVTRH